MDADFRVAGQYSNWRYNGFMRYFFCMLVSIAGLLVTLLLLVTLYIGVREATSVQDSPQQWGIGGAIDLAKSHKSAWVAITDAVADCKSTVRYTVSTSDGGVRDAMLFVAHNADRSLSIVVDARDVRECGYVGNVHYIGMLKSLESAKRNGFMAQGLPLPESGGPQYWLCTDCQPGDEWLVVAVVLLLMIASGWLTRKVYRARRD
jgi:hypothetical protein